MYKIAQKVQDQEMKQHKLQYDQRVKCSKLEPGDLAQLCKCAFYWKHKIQDHWEHTVYEVKKRCYGHVPVYKIRPHDEKEKPNVIHRNLLLQIAHDHEKIKLEPSTGSNDSDDESMSARHITRSQTRHKVQASALYYIQEAMTSTTTYLTERLKF